MTEPRKYRTKPVEVEAMGPLTVENAAEIEEWCASNGTDSYVSRAFGQWSLALETPEGVMAATPGDFIIHGLVGEFYPCKPECFYVKYELAEGEDQP